MNNKYYYGYILNPEEERNSDFDERTKIGCVLIEKEDGLRELFTDAKYFVVRENQVIDGKKVFESDSSLIGTVEKEITMEDVVDFEYKDEIDKREYVNLLIKLIYNTRKFAILKEKEYLETEKEFVKIFRK